MALRKISTVLLLTVTAIVLVQFCGVSVVNALDQKNYFEVFAISLSNASYGDFDGDLNNDDISCLLHVFTNIKDSVAISFLIILTLPNGEDYAYSFIISPVYANLTLQLFFINHAYIPGDYIIYVEGILHSQGLYQSEYYIIFDPPTEQVPDDVPFLAVQIV